MFEVLDTIDQQAVIKVIGVGGGGGNALEHMVSSGLDGVEFINANTDAQVLSRSSAETKIQMGSSLTKGLGAGSNPDVGQQAALEDKEAISDALGNADMVFITAGMGGGTGTGAAPIIAEVAKEKGILTVAVVTRPFPFEGRKRAMIADKGICELAESVDSLITIPNEKILTVLGKQAKLTDAFAKANDVLYNAVQGIAELITQPGLINVDFADVKTVMSEMGMAMMGSSMSAGDDRAVDAARAAISSPFLEDVDISGARGVLVNVTAGLDLEIGEFDAVGQIIQEYASDDATVVVGTAIDPDMDDALRVTIVATGIGNRRFGRAENRQRTPVRAQARETEREFAEPVFLKEVENDVDDMSPRRSRARQPMVSGANALASKDDEYMEELDIPTFLRRQAD